MFPGRWREGSATRLHRIPERRIWAGPASHLSRSSEALLPSPRTVRCGLGWRASCSTPEGQQVVELRDHNSLGRHPTNTIQLLDKIVSKEHCIIERRRAGFLLRDLGSLNGTYINGERVDGERTLKHGDDIALGSTRARFDDGSGPPDRAAAPGTARRLPATSAAAVGLAAAAASAARVQPSARRRAALRARCSPGASPRQRAGDAARADAAVAQARCRPPSARRCPRVPITVPRHGTRVDVNDQARAIGTQIAATKRGFCPFDQLATQPAAARAPTTSGCASRTSSRARSRSSATCRSCSNKILLSDLQVRARRPRRHLPEARQTASSCPAPASAATARTRRSGVVHDHEPRRSRSARPCSPTTPPWISPPPRARA